MLVTSSHALLPPVQMAQADALAIAAGVSGVDLMAAAGRAVADAIQARWSTGTAVVLCGPGNNGGDGFVIAQRLRQSGWRVRLALLGDKAALKEDAAWHAGLWEGDVQPMAPSVLEEADLVVDALFGAGLARDIDGVAATVLSEVARRQLPVCAVDIPSGVDGATGALRGIAVQTALTVTFFRKKPGHVLLPGRVLCGETVVADIGIPESVLETVMPSIFENAPPMWLHHFPWPRLEAHKYERGHVLVMGGATTTGAARLVALAASRIGAGLVTVAAPKEAWQVYAASLNSIMVEAMEDGDLAPALRDRRRNALVLGPGAGLTDQTRHNVLSAAASGRPLVLDADALTIFEDDPDQLFSALKGPCVLTPHDGEYQRLFSAGGDRLARARYAARKSAAVVVLKGPDTVIAEPGGRAVINSNASAWLATAGSGDVLAGMVAGLLAQGMPVFEAACAAVWIHGAAGTLAGPGLMSEDLPGLLPHVLRQLLDEVSKNASA